MAEFRYIGTEALIARGLSAMTAAVTESAEDLVGRAQSVTPVDTGTLKASIHPEEPRVSATTVSVRVQTGGEANGYAVYVHEGTGPHEIRPTHAKFLHFGDTFAKVVHHPGTTATKFLEGPLLEMAPVYREAIARAGRAAY